MFNNAYEVLAYLSNQCGLFKPIEDEMLRLKEENEMLKGENSTIKETVDNLVIELLMNGGSV